MTILYDDACGLCKVMLALLLTWDRDRRLRPAPIQSRCGATLLAGLESAERLGSWHVVEEDGTLHSAGAGVPIVFAALPGGALVARMTGLLPITTQRAYGWTAAHRGLLGRPLSTRRLGWAGRVIADREGGATADTAN